MSVEGQEEDNKKGQELGTVGYNRNKNSLYNLLPSIYRQHEFDTPAGPRSKPLQGLLEIIEEQAAVLESDIRQLYDNWFIETCQEWVVPYIAELLGVRGVRPASRATYSQRSWVANTLSHRQRKGTLAILEQLARDATGWNATVVEFFQYISATQHMNHVRPSVTTCNVRDAAKLDLEGSSFGKLSHIADIRNIESRRGKYNIPNMGIFLWRLQSFQVEKSPAYGHRSGKFSFDPLGRDIQLFTHPKTEKHLTQITQEINVPGPIRRWALHTDLESYYGAGRSINITLQDGSAVDPSRIVASDLTEWHNRPKKGHVAVDPVLGRILFPSGENPKQVFVDYYYGFSGEVGGGSYLRREEGDPAAAITVRSGGEVSSIKKAISEWKKNPVSAVIEIADSSVYEESLDELDIPPDVTLVIRAGKAKRPVIKLSKTLVLASTSPSIQHGTRGVMLEGLMIQCPDTAIAVKKGDLDFLKIRHSTLVPNLDLKTRSVEVKGGNDRLVVSLENAICGSITAEDTEARIEAKDSIIDGKGKVPALSCYAARIERCTIFGLVKVVSMDLASNSIFTQPVRAERRQKGCVRFCYLPQGSRVPHQYRCQPVYGQYGNDDDNGGGGSNGNEAVSAISDSSKAIPLFISETYGEPGYAQLHIETHKAIAEGAEDGNEMGVFNHLAQKHRLDNLAACLDEYLRFGLQAGVYLVT
jgi:hypothetical protein